MNIFEEIYMDQKFNILFKTKYRVNARNRYELATINKVLPQHSINTT